MKATIIIPSRLASSRLPEKPLIDIFGMSLLMRVYYQAKKSALADDVIIATDHIKIYNHAKDHGAKVMMTSDEHKSGTDRIAEVALNLESDIIINLQGDEPLIHPNQIDALIRSMLQPEIVIGTQCRKIVDENSIFDYNIVKVVRDIHDRALYFSRQAIPAVRDEGYAGWYKQIDYFAHVGLYGFKKSVLLELTQLPVSSYEISECLEQLRWLQNGYTVHCVNTEYTSIGVDTEDDLEKVREFLFKETFH